MRRPAAVFVLIVSAMALLVSLVVPTPASAKTTLPYPNRKPVQVAHPWQCGTPTWSPTYGKCKEWLEYMDVFHATQGKGRRQEAVTAVLAQSGIPGWAERFGYAATYGTPGCQDRIRFQVGHFVNDMYLKGKWSDMVKLVVRFMSVKHGKLLFPSAKVVADAAAKVSEKAIARLQSRNIMMLIKGTCGT